MNIKFLLFFVMFLICTVVAKEDTLYIDIMQSSTSLYRALYEEGLYDDAIRILDSLIKEDTLHKIILLFELASCYIAKGDTINGRKVCEQIIKEDPAFYPDTIFTSPKILKVFRDVKEKYLTSMKKEGTFLKDTIQLSLDTTSEALLEYNKRVQKEIILSDEFTPTFSSQYNFKDIIKYSVGIAPLGIGHFVIGQKTKGFLIFTGEIVSICGMIWAYNTREKYFEGGPTGHGWYEGNEKYYRKYTTYSRISFGFLLGIYLYEVGDYFYQLKKEK